jgi:hypothetical protein
MDDWNWPKAFTTVAFFVFVAFMAVTYSQCLLEVRKTEVKTEVNK